MNNMEQLKGIYFYNGFNKPNKLADNLSDFMDDLKNKDTVLTTNYLGDVSDELLDELTYVAKDNRTIDDDINNALYVVSKYEMLEYNNITLKNGDKLKSLDGYEIIVFPTFKYNSKTDSYKWTYDTKNTNNYYCLDKKTESYSKYSNYACGDFVKLTLDKKWCSLYKESTLSSNKEISKYCEN